MSVDQYLKQAAALGVGRGALAEDARFPTEDGPLGNGAIGHDSDYVNRKARAKVNRETLGLPTEDLTHLNPGRSAKGGRPRKDRRQ